MQEFLESVYEDCGRRASGVPHVLCVQDTTELNYGSHSGRIDPGDEHFGYGTSNLESNCLFAHPVMALDASSGFPLGFSSMKIWGRGNDSPGKKLTRKNRPLSEKESYRWAESAATSARFLPADVRKTMVGDRENDIYEVMCDTLGSGCDFLIRSSYDRMTAPDGKRLSGVMEALPVAGKYEFPLEGRKDRRKRTAVMEVRFGEVTVLAPVNAPDGVPGELKVWCIHTRECEDSVPEGEEPVEWRLLTSHEVRTVAQAVTCIGWYKLRWSVESLFRVVKSKGFALEDAQVETGEAMIKLIGMSFVAALHCMMLKTAFEERAEHIPASIVFTDAQMLVLRAVLPMLEPRSPRHTKGRNPYREGTLTWAAWIVAKIGGWNGGMTANERPGYITFHRGWEQLHVMGWGAELALKNVYKD